MPSSTTSNLTSSGSRLASELMTDTTASRVHGKAVASRGQDREEGGRLNKAQTRSRFINIKEGSGIEGAGDKCQWIYQHAANMWNHMSPATNTALHQTLSTQLAENIVSFLFRLTFTAIQECARRNHCTENISNTTPRAMNTQYAKIE
jgi:hypothetical protein